MEDGPMQRFLLAVSLLVFGLTNVQAGERLPLAMSGPREGTEMLGWAALRPHELVRVPLLGDTIRYFCAMMMGPQCFDVAVRIPLEKIDSMEGPFTAKLEIDKDVPEGEKNRKFGFTYQIHAVRTTEDMDWDAEIRAMFPKCLAMKTGEITVYAADPTPGMLAMFSQGGGKAGEETQVILIPRDARTLSISFGNTRKPGDLVTILKDFETVKPLAGQKLLPAHDHTFVMEFSNPAENLKKNAAPLYGDAAKLGIEESQAQEIRELISGLEKLRLTVDVVKGLEFNVVLDGDKAVTGQNYYTMLKNGAAYVQEELKKPEMKEDGAMKLIGLLVSKLQIGRAADGKQTIVKTEKPIAWKTFEGKSEVQQTGFEEKN
jgi:hypothetical protein